LNWLRNQNSTTDQEHALLFEEILNGSSPRNYDAAAEAYLHAFQNASGLRDLKARSITAFTSDYALYWFDYLAGYDVLFAQFGWNFARAPINKNHSSLAELATSENTLSVGLNNNTVGTFTLFCAYALVSQEGYLSEFYGSFNPKRIAKFYQQSNSPRAY